MTQIPFDEGLVGSFFASLSISLFLLDSPLVNLQATQKHKPIEGVKRKQARYLDSTQSSDDHKMLRERGVSTGAQPRLRLFHWELRCGTTQASTKTFFPAAFGLIYALAKWLRGPCVRCGAAATPPLLLLQYELILKLCVHYSS